MPEDPATQKRAHIALDANASGSAALAQLGQGHQNNYFGVFPYIPPVSEWMRLADVDPMILGVHRCRPVDRNNELTPYVQRDVDTRIKESISRSQHGGFTLVVGDSTAGKTRSLYEALVEACPDGRIYSPSTSASIQQVPQLAAESTHKCVLWLDDLERYIGPDGVEPFLVGSLIGAGVCIAGTLRAERYEAFMPRAERAASLMQDTSAQHISRVGMQVLNIADTIEMDRVWSSREIQQARYIPDPRIVEAIDRHGRYGIAEYLAAGPPLYGEWKRALRANGNPRGHALVAAAIDLARAGLTDPIELSDLEALHHLYLDQAGGPLLRPEGIEEAVEWATSVRFGVTSLLMPAEDDKWRAFDYLVDSASRDDREFPQGDSFWLAAVSLADDDWEYFSVTLAASKNGRRELTEDLWADLAKNGDGHAAYHLAVHFRELDDEENHERWVRKSAATGNRQALLMLGELEIDRGNFEDAILNLTKGLELGEEDCAWRLGSIYNHLGNPDKAEEFWRTGQEMGSIGAGVALGIYLAEKGERKLAIESFRKCAAIPGAFSAQYNLAYALNEDGSRDEAKFWYQQAADSGHERAQTNLAVLLTEEGDVRTALTYFRKAADLGDGLGACHAADLELLMGHEEQAKDLYEKSFELNYIHAANHLGALHLRLGDLPVAKHWFRVLLAHGDPSAGWNLGMIKICQGEIPDPDDLVLCTWPANDGEWGED